MSNISWNCHENPFTRFSVILLGSTDQDKIIEPGFNGLNTIPKCFRLSHIRPVLKMWKSVYPFWCDNANKHAFLKKKNGKINHVCKGLKLNSPICSHCSLHDILPILSISWISFATFSAILITDTHGNQQRWKHKPRHLAEVMNCVSGNYSFVECTIYVRANIDLPYNNCYTQ